MINDEKGDFRCIEVDSDEEGKRQVHYNTQENWSVAVNMVNQNYCQ